jgi:hypothetical protein
LLADILAGATGFAGITGTRLAALHAVFGHIVFACIAAAALFAFMGAPDSVNFRQRKLVVKSAFPLRGLALWLPPLIATQVAMGAAYRHGQWGILPHLAGAMLVAFLLLAESVVLLQNTAEHILLRRAARLSLATVIAQVSLGVSDYLVRLLDFQDTTAWLLLSVAHVTVGSLTFAASIYLAVSVRYCVGEGPRSTEFTVR